MQYVDLHGSLIKVARGNAGDNIWVICFVSSNFAAPFLVKYDDDLLQQSSCPPYDIFFVIIYR